MVQACSGKPSAVPFHQERSAGSATGDESTNAAASWPPQPPSFADTVAHFRSEFSTLQHVAFLLLSVDAIVAALFVLISAFLECLAPLFFVVTSIIALIILHLVFVLIPSQNEYSAVVRGVPSIHLYAPSLLCTSVGTVASAILGVGLSIDILEEPTSLGCSKFFFTLDNILAVPLEVLLMVCLCIFLYGVAVAFVALVYIMVLSCWNLRRATQYVNNTCSPSDARLNDDDPDVAEKVIETVGDLEESGSSAPLQRHTQKESLFGRNSLLYHPLYVATFAACTLLVIFLLLGIYLVLSFIPRVLPCNFRV